MSGVPTDRRVDRRAFLERMAALTAAAAAGSVFTPGPAYGGSIDPGAGAPPLALPPRGPMQATDPVEMTLAELAELIRNGVLSPVELVDAYLERIGRYDAVLQVFNTVTAEAARAAARTAEGQVWTGPLHGIPLAIKDNYFTAGVRTTANSHIFADLVPEYDATAWRRLRDAGAVLLGKTQMGPLATSRATTPDGEATTRNAWAPLDPSVSPGGSSSGSATAVAARLAASSTGTQTGGSITTPSLAQGLTGIKPTMGRVSLRGIIPLTYTRDHPGPLARDALDAALMLLAMAGPDTEDPRTLGLPPVPDLVEAATPVARGTGFGLRWPTTVGVPPGYLDRDEEARRAMLATFESLGARVVEVEMPAEWETLTSFSFNNVRLPERTEPFLEYLRQDVRLFGVSLSPWINGLLLSGPEYLRGQRAKLLLLRRILDDLFAQCDVVLQTRPFPFDMVGLPLIAFPIGSRVDDEGRTLPVGAMLGGQPFAEDRLLSLAAAYQAVTEWHRMRPADPAADEGEGDASRREGDGGGRGTDRAGKAGARAPGTPAGRTLRLDVDDIDREGE